ncbi:AzlD domain-containing protein [Histidinibacterium lentulum]|uniref:AzlD domain-containing protein n=1 Tax=Histidinibacterium lentulum TaxID=2480588 RepID=A0A3N2R551_9RHOB|nr:AzlD domain-containing protein [Histidinibacterium lentulum]ROU02554.1 AzlD domain-containing protein [Histidinibacterium lentulum]
MSDAQIWALIGCMAVGTFLIRFSFLGLVGDRPLPGWLLRLLRYTPVAVIPAIVAPLVAFPAATGGETDPVRLAAAVAALAVGAWRRDVILAVGAGALMLYGGLWIMG